MYCTLFPLYSIHKFSMYFYRVYKDKCKLLILYTFLEDQSFASEIDRPAWIGRKFHQACYLQKIFLAIP